MSGSGWKARDLDLLDAIDKLDPVQVQDTVWRVVRQGRDPLLGHPSKGRWDPGTFDVLYTAFEAKGALAEMYYHLSRQPVFPSRIEFTLNEVRASTEKTLKFADMRELEMLGVDAEKFATLDYQRTQEIGDAAQFLGFDGVIAPSARWTCLILVIFTDCLSSHQLELGESSVIQPDHWPKRH